MFYSDFYAAVWMGQEEGGGKMDGARSHGVMERPDYGDLSDQLPWLGHLNC